MLKQTAIKKAGTATALAAILGISKQAVSKWGEHIPELQEFRLRKKRPSWFSKGKK